MTTWHIITPEFPPKPGGVSDYTALLAPALEQAGQSVRVWSHEFGGFSPRECRQVGRQLDSFPESRRLLLEWVPHAFGYRSMNLGFCRWIAARPEPLEIMVHEPGLGFGEGGIRHDAVAAVHRLMAILLLHRASQVWISVPRWESRLRPLGLGRKIPFTWLPVPSNIEFMHNCAQSRTNPVGYFGQYDDQSREVLTQILEELPQPVLLLGRDAARVSHPNAVIAGDLPPAELSCAIQSCTTMMHWYPDGVSTRRGTIMASLAHGRAIVTNPGRWTEPIWRSSKAVAFASDAAGFVLRVQEILGDCAKRAQLCTNALGIYRENFAIENTVRTMLAAPR